MHAPLSSTRVDLFHALLRSLGRSPEDITSRLSGFDVVVDRVGHGPWRTAKRAWLRAEQHGATHQMVLQDDVIVATDFIEAAKAALTAVPDQIVTFYSTRRKAAEAALASGISWFRSPMQLYGPCIAMPVGLVRDFIDWEATYIRDGLVGDDIRVSLFAYTTKRDIWATVPSLVQHNGVGHSILGHDWSMRTPYFATGSALDIDWTHGLPTPPRVSGTGYLPALAKKWVKGFG